MQEELFDERNQHTQISWHCPSQGALYCTHILPMKTSPRIHQSPMGRSSPMNPEMHCVTPNCVTCKGMDRRWRSCVGIDEPAEWTPRILAPNTNSWSSRYGQKVAPVHYTGIYSVLARLSAPIPNTPAVCIWCNILVVHSAGSSILNSFTYAI